MAAHLTGGPSSDPSEKGGRRSLRTASRNPAATPPEAAAGPFGPRGDLSRGRVLAEGERLVAEEEPGTVRLDRENPVALGEAIALGHRHRGSLDRHLNRALVDYVLQHHRPAGHR